MTEVLVRPANMPEFRTSIDQLRADVTAGLAPANVLVSLDGGASWLQAWQAAGLSPPASSTDEAAKYIIPIGRSGWAILTGYLSLLTLFLVLFEFVLLVFVIERPRTNEGVVFVIGVLCALGIPAQLLTAMLGHRAIRNNPKLLGMGRVIFTYVCTGLLAALSVAILVANAVAK